MGDTPTDRNLTPGDRRETSARRTGKNVPEVPVHTKRETEDPDRRLSEVKRNVKNGVYNRPSLVNSIVEKMIGKKTFGRIGAGPGKSRRRNEEYTGMPDIRQDRVKEVKRSVSCNKYSDSRVLNAVAERILEKLGIR